MVKQFKIVEDLVNEFHWELTEKEKEDLEKVLRDFPGRLNERLITLAKNSKAIFNQFVPSPIEALSLKQDPIYKSRTSPIKGLERGYSDRAILTPTMNCPCFCRYCFLRGRDFGGSMSDEEIDQAMNYIKTHPEIKYILITGGDPLLNFPRLKKVVSKLMEIETVDSIRVGTRMILYNPLKFDEAFYELVAKVQDAGKRFEIGAHMNHPDEIDIHTQRCIENLFKKQVTVYTQTVLLRDINDDSQTLLNLYRKVYKAGGEIYLLFHCDPIKGSSHLRTTISKGLDLKVELADSTSGRLVPKYKVAKCEIGIDSRVLEINDDHIWIETPYSIKNLKQIIPDYEPNFPIERVSKNGRLIIKYFGKWC